jgi:alpha-ketoglutarate-dependent taurine dioxygenase
MSALSQPEYESVEQVPATHSRTRPQPTVRPLTPIEPLVTPSAPFW